MSETSPPGLGDDLRSLRRSRSDRVVAGVLGGLAQRLGVDPLLLRIITVVLALFGGVGIVLYALGWLLVPDEDADGSVAEQALRFGSGRSPDAATVALAAGLVIVVLVAAGGTFGSRVGSILLVLAVLGAVMLLRRRDGEPDRPAGDDGYSQGASAADLQNGADDQDDTPFSAPVGWPEGPDWGPAEPYTEQVEPQPKPRPRSYLGLLTVSAVVVAMGILAIIDAATAAIPVSAYIGTALAIVGLGLLVGTWFGRSRGLIVLGVVLALALPPAVFVVDNLDLRADSTTVTLTSLDQVPDEVLTHGAGTVTYDLSGLVLDDDDEVTLRVSQSVGQLRVVVPPEADVTLAASADLGNVIAFYADGSGGFGPSVTITDDGVDGPGGGSITLDLDLRIGQIEVTRGVEELTP